MGLLEKVKSLEQEEASQNEGRYFFVRSSIASLLSELNIEYASFLLKKAGFFYLSLPFGLDSETFRKTEIDASLIASKLQGGASCIAFSSDDLKNSGETVGMGSSILSGAFLFPMDELGVEFLLLKFEDESLDIANKDVYASIENKIGSIKKTYKENEMLVKTCLPSFPKYTGSTSIESKLQGSIVASTVANFMEFSFSDMFDFSLLHNDVDSLVIFYSIVNRISALVGKSNLTVLKKDLSLCTCVFSSQCVDEAIYSATLKNVLSSIYGTSLIKKLKINFFYDVKNAKDEIKSWIEDSYLP